MTDENGSGEFTGWRELWLVCGAVDEGSSFVFTLVQDGGFVSFVRHDHSVALCLQLKRQHLLVSECNVNKRWRNLGNLEIDGLNIDIQIIVERTGYGVLIRINGSDKFVELEVDLCGVERVCGAGQIGDFSYNSKRSESIIDLNINSLENVDQLKCSDSTEWSEDLIFDFGMHSGSDTAFYLAKGFRVVAVEANPQIAQGCVSRFAEAIHSGRLKILNLGVAEQSGVMPFYISLINSEQSSFNRAMAERLGPVRVEEIKTITPYALWSAFGVPYYAKIDIEGLDSVVVRSLVHLPVKPKYISFECDFMHWTNSMEVLLEAGYRRFKVIDQMRVHDLRLPKRQREGLSIEHKFLRGSSGSFGEDTQGSWSSAEQIPEAIARLRAANPENNGWIDIHGGL